MYTRGLSQLAKATPRLGTPLVLPYRSGLLHRPRTRPLQSPSRVVPLLVIPYVPGSFSFHTSTVLRLPPQDKDRGRVEGSTEISHSAFISSASPESDFNPTQQPSAGTSTSTSTSTSGAPSPNPNPDSTHSSRTFSGRLSPTSSHLFKLILPIPTSLTSPEPPAQPTAFLLHPSQPLSHLSRLIAGSLPPGERDAEIQFLALTGQEGDVDSHLRNAEEEEEARARMEGDGGDRGGDEVEMAQSSRQEGGPFLEERSRNAGRFQEVSWSPSTDLSDFIKQSCLDERFKIVIKTEAPSRHGNEAVSRSPANPDRGARANGEAKDGHGPGPTGLILEVAIPSFASRTTFLRRRLLDLTKKLDTMTKQKKAIDIAAHKGAQRLAIVALMAGVAYWAAIVRWTFFTDAGWDLMEPVTWATGFATLLSGCAFLIYHNREVSYSSLLDLSITARQRRLYDKHGLDVEKWTEMVADAKSLRREISRIAADYDIEWKGELENFDDSQPLEGRLPPASASKSKSKSDGSDNDSPNESSKSNTHSGSDSGSRDSDVTSSSGHPNPDDGSMNDRSGHSRGKIKPGTVENERGESIDIDKTIDEADELASQSKEKREKEKAAQRKGEVIDSAKEEGGEGVAREAKKDGREGERGEGRE